MSWIWTVTIWTIWKPKIFLIAPATKTSRFFFLGQKKTPFHCFFSLSSLPFPVWVNNLFWLAMNYFFRNDVAVGMERYATLFPDSRTPLAVNPSFAPSAHTRPGVWLGPACIVQQVSISNKLLSRKSARAKEQRLKHAKHTRHEGGPSFVLRLLHTMCVWWGEVGWGGGSTNAFYRPSHQNMNFVAAPLKGFVFFYSNGSPSSTLLLWDH